MYTNSQKTTEVTGDWITITKNASNGQFTMVASPKNKALVANPAASLALFLEIKLVSQSAHPGHS